MPKKSKIKAKRERLLKSAIPAWEEIDFTLIEEDEDSFDSWFKERLFDLKARNLRFIEAISKNALVISEANEGFVTELTDFLNDDHVISRSLAQIPDKFEATAHERAHTILVFKQQDKSLGSSRINMLLHLPGSTRRAVLDAEARTRITEKDVWTYIEAFLRREEEKSGQVFEAIEEYLLDIQNEVSPKLFEKRLEHLVLFNGYLIGEAKLSNITMIEPKTIWGFIGYWYSVNAGVSANHALEILRSVRCFLLWLDEVHETDIAKRCREILKSIKTDLPAAIEAEQALRSFVDGRPDPAVDEETRQLDNFLVVEVQDMGLVLANFTADGPEYYSLSLPKQYGALLKPDFTLNAVIAKRPGEAVWELISCGPVLPRMVL